MQTSKLNARIRPTLFQMFVYCLICFWLSFILQLFFHYQSYMRYSEQQCIGLLDSSTLDINYRNEAGIKNYFSDIQRDWLYAWRIHDQAQGFNISGVNSNAGETVYPRITIECNQPNNQYLKLELTTQVQLNTTEGLVLFLSSSFLTGLLLSSLLLVRNERKDNQEAVNEFFYEIALHRNSNHIIGNDHYASLAEQLNDNKLSLLNYLDEIQHRLQRADEEFTEQLIAHNSELEERYAYLEIQTREMKNLTTKKSSFFANLSHDFRTPLYTLHGYIRLLHETGLDQEQRKHIRALEGAYNNLSELVTNFLSMSRLEAGSMNIENSKVDLGKMLHEVIDGMRFLLPDKNNILLLDVSSDIPTELVFDANKLRQIATNLITNAAKYTENGVIYIHCDSMKVDDNTANISLSVADTGKGISAEEIKTIFDPYTRLERDRTTIPGTGLGLGICKELCEVINAQLNVDSVVGQGTVFSVNLTANMNSETAADPVTPDQDISCIHLISANNIIEQHLVQLLNNMSLPYQLHTRDDIPSLAKRLKSDARVLIVLDKNHSDDLDALPELEKHTRQVIVSVHKDELSLAEKNILKPFTILSNVITNHEFIQAINASDTDITSTHAILSASNLDGYRILLAEDNDLNRFIIEDTLNKLGATVISCADGAAALDLYQAGEYSAILLDAHMPKLGGTEVTRAIRREHQDTETAIIGVTASTSSTEYQHFIQSGMSDCLIKPLKDEELVNAITKLGTKISQLEKQDKKTHEAGNASANLNMNELSASLEVKIDDKLQALISKGLQTHSEKLKHLSANQPCDWDAIYDETHKLNGSLSIGSYQNEREYCQIVENALRTFCNNESDAVSETELQKLVAELIVRIDDQL